jgi:DNA polymerase III gamma/tau subunit
MLSKTSRTVSFEPTSLSDFVFSDQQSRMELEAIVTGKISFPEFGKVGILLWGTYGTGKTTLAKMLPKLLEASADLKPTVRSKLFNNETYGKFTACGMSNNSVAMIGDLVERCQTSFSESPSGWHYEILDELDTLTPAAQASLKSVMSNARSTIFIFTTNNPTKIDGGIKSRSYFFGMNKADDQEYLPLGRRILNKISIEETKITDQELLDLAKHAQGSIRDFGSAVVGLANLRR